MEKSGLILCPDFQRGHVWTEKQQEDYITFLLRAILYHLSLVSDNSQDGCQLAPRVYNVDVSGFISPETGANLPLDSARVLGFNGPLNTTEVFPPELIPAGEGVPHRWR